jgi:Ni,Fe-hydrogenase III small subunit/ferredoxin
VPLWTLRGLLQGKATTPWPLANGDDGQEGVHGMPNFDSGRCEQGCKACAEICPTGAIVVGDERGKGERIEVDYGRCVVCQLCVENCPTGAASYSFDWAFGTTDRFDLKRVAGAHFRSEPRDTSQSRKDFRRSLHIRHVDAGSCNGCESELQALNNPFYNLHRLGIFFTPSPRFADLLLVTGPVTYAMREPLLRAYDAMPEPRWVMAVGTCAVSGGVAGGGYACGNGLTEVLPVDLYLPGCPPNPAALISAFLMFLDSSVVRTGGAQYVK